MHPTTIIRKPLITEKATYASGEFNRYHFAVDMRADKTQIKQAIEAIYKVRVLRVNTQTRKGKARMTRLGALQKPDTKRAIVRIHPDDKIELF
jgi:large subunit ribosomal protein L23